MKTIFIVAGDPSGDIHSANLMSMLNKIHPEVKFIGIGGEKMVEKGLQLLASQTEISFVGFAEVFKNILTIKKIFNLCTNYLNEHKNEIDLVILVDFPGFNLRLGKIAKKLNIPVSYYIAPQIWAWGQNRAELLKKIADIAFVVFPFEVDFYQNFGIEAHFVGHPILDLPIFNEPPPLWNEREKIFAIFPGSRLQEIKAHSNILNQLAEKLKQKYPDYKTVIAVPNFLLSSVVMKFPYQNAEITTDNYELLRTAKFGIIKTGTSNLEAALLGLPFVMFYQTSLLTYLIGKKLMKSKYLSIVNILHNANVVPELIQKEANSENIIKIVDFYLSNQDSYIEFQQKLLELRKVLGESGASKRAAKIISEFIHKKS